MISMLLPFACWTIPSSENEVIHMGDIYVVLTGMSCDPSHVEEAKRNDPNSIDDFCIVVKNPASSTNKTDYVTPFLLNKAWRSNGTDDDIYSLLKTLLITLKISNSLLSDTLRTKDEKLTLGN